jgi:hypothetical protein
MNEQDDHFLENVNKMAKSLEAGHLLEFVTNKTLMGERFKEAATNGRNWTEDFSHENGYYECLCGACKRVFFGHKRRITCKTCVKV